jgi:hypothetical protein
MTMGVEGTNGRVGCFTAATFSLVTLGSSPWNAITEGLIETSFADTGRITEAASRSLTASRSGGGNASSAAFSGGRGAPPSVMIEGLLFGGATLTKDDAPAPPIDRARSADVQTISRKKAAPEKSCN